MTNVKPRTPKQEDRRHRILSATRQLVADHGYEGTVMSQVAESAGVSPTTLYNLYNTKDELLLEALRELIIENYQKIDGESKGPGWQYLLRVVENGAWLRGTNPAYGDAITNALLRATPGDALVELLLKNVRYDFRTSLSAMKDRSELLDDVHIEHLATLMMGNYWSTFIMLNKGVEKNKQMLLSLQLNLLSTLVASTRNPVSADIAQCLASLRKTGASDV